MKRMQLPLAISLAFCLSNIAIAADSGSRYKSWRPPAGDTVQTANKPTNNQLQKMIDELNQLIDDADKARAADRTFIQDLRDVVNQYDWPWRNTLLEEDFTDGYLDKNARWKILAGDFELKRGLGLHSETKVRQPVKQTSQRRSDRDAAAALFGAILDQAMKNKKQDKQSAEPVSKAGNASIINEMTITNAFAIDMKVDVQSQNGHLEIGVYQGQPGSSGYRLSFLPGPSASIEVQRIGSRGKSIIDIADKLNASGDKIHHLQWTRGSQGNMEIKLNGKTILQTADRAYKDKFNGIMINNEGGEFSLQQLTIQGS